jgi:hypothetical protein
MPARLAITRADGSTEIMEVPVSDWLNGARRTTVTIAAPETITKIEIDPENAFPDIDRSNNVWTSSPSS